MTQPSGDAAADLDKLLGKLTGELPAAEPVEAPSRNPQAPELLYPDVREWMQEYFVHVIERRIATGGGTGVFWCAQWWAHPEALSRFYALWRAWESLRVADPATGMSVWFRDHLDPHLRELTSEIGPFARCQPAIAGKQAKHHTPEPLPIDPMPDEVLAQFPEDRT